MGKVVDAITPDLRAFIEAQHVFFVATAPTSADGHVNLSPKGYDTFRILDDRTVAYLDLTGSGVETIAHLRDNGRITILFCAFDGPPRIVRLHGTGDAVLAGDDGFDDLAAAFPPLPGARAVVRVACTRISTSCGYSIPRFTYEGERDTLVEWAERRGDVGISDYWGTRNAVSIDGLPGV